MELRRRERIARVWEGVQGCSRCGSRTNLHVYKTRVGRRSRPGVFCESCAAAAGLIAEDSPTLIATRSATIPYLNGLMVINLGDRVGPSSYAAKNAPKGVLTNPR